MPIKFQEIVTQRLELRRLQAGDAATMFAYRSNPVVAKFQSWMPESFQETRSFIADNAATELDTADTWFQIGIVKRSDDKLVGDCGLHFPKDSSRQVELGITLAHEHQHQGYASEALTAVLSLVFGELGKHRVFASVDPRNSAAIALLQRAGMRQEAHHIESYWHNGTWVDDAIFALLQREWKAGHPNP